MVRSSLSFIARLTTLSVPLGLAVCAALPARATDFVREIAKNDSKVVIVSSGKQGDEIALAAQTAILRHAENKHKPADVRVVTLADAPKEIAAMGARVSVLFCLAGREVTPGDWDAVRRFVPENASLLGSRTGFVSGKPTNNSAGKTAYLVTFYAPDAPRLNRLYNRFLSTQRGNFRELILSETYAANRVAVFSSPDVVPNLRAWGTMNGITGSRAVASGTTGVWDDVAFYTLAERDALTPDALEERDEIYLLDRSRGDVPPVAAAPLLADVPIKPTTIARRSRTEPDGDTVTVFSVPNSRHLAIRLSERYTTAPQLANAPETEELLDLRTVQNSAIVVLGSDVPDGDKEQIRSLVASALRQTLKVQVQEGGTALRALQKVVATEQLLGGTGTELRKKLGTRYVWVLGISEYSGETRYDSTVKRMTPLPTAFPGYRPEKPSKGRKESDADFANRMNEWRDKANEWERNKREHDETVSNAPAEYVLDANRVNSAQVQGTLQLIDLQNRDVAGAVVWERGCRGGANDIKSYKNEVRRLRNRDSEPGAIAVPAPEANCPPAVRYVASRDAAMEAINALNRTALLPDKLAGATVAALVKRGISDGDGTGAASDVPVVVECDGKTVIISAGTTSGVRPGDLISVVLKTREVRDPQGNLLSTRIVEQVSLKVVAADARTADCVAVTTPATEAAKVAKIKVGMPIQHKKGKP